MTTLNGAEYAIRSVEPADSEALTVLAHRSKAHWGYPPEWVTAWTAELTLTPEYLRTHEGFVATTDAVPIGVCMLEIDRFNGVDAELAHMWIAPEHHGRGIGRQLVKRALASARLEAVSRVRVVSDPFAEPFYLRLGARRISEIPAPMSGAACRVLPVLEFVIRRA